jgi:hypothetical protein
MGQRDVTGRDQSRDSVTDDGTLLVSVSDAAAILGISEAGVRKRIQRGQLTGQKVDGNWILAVPRDSVTGQPEPLSRDRHAPRHATERDSVTVTSPTEQGQRQLETLRDTLLKPHLELIERQQVTLMEQAERIGRLEAERDALTARLSAVETPQVESPTEVSNASEMVTERVWWRFWDRK